MTYRQLSRVEAVKARAQDARARLEARRPSNRVVDLLFRFLSREKQAGGGLLAGAIAFRIFLFLVPYVFVLVVGFGLGADAADVDVQDMARRAGIAGLAASAIQASANASTATQWVTLAVAAFALVLGARNLITSIQVAHALIWRVPQQRLHHVTRKGLAFIALLSLALLLLRLINAIRDVSVAAWLFALLLFTVVPAGVWLVTSLRLFPRRAGTTWRQMWPGSALFGVGVQSLHVVTIVWATRSIEAKSQTYGAIGAALTILLWAYMLGRVVTASAALNAALAGAGQDAETDAAATPADQADEAAEADEATPVVRLPS